MYSHRNDEFQTKYGKIIAILVSLFIGLCVIFSVLIGYSNIMVDFEVVEQPEIAAYDKS